MIEFNDEQAFEGIIQAGLPAEIATNYVEMGTAVRSGILWEDFSAKNPLLSGTKLEEFAREFAKVYLA